jgi:hypothetical protein
MRLDRAIPQQVASRQRLSPIDLALEVYQIARMLSQGLFVLQLATQSTFFPGPLEFPILVSEYLIFSAIDFILGCYMAYGAMKLLIVIMSHILAHYASVVLQRQWSSGSYALTFDRLMPSRNFPVALRIIRRNPNMCHTADPDKLFEIPGYKLWSVV